MNAVSISFLAYTLGIVAFGLYSSRFARRTSADFFLANRGLSGSVAALSASASSESGWVTLGLVGMSFNVGIGALWIVPGTLLAFAFNWLVLARRLRSLAAEQRAITVLDVLSARYPPAPAHLIRALGILILTVMLTIYVAAQITAAAKTIEATFHWDYLSGVAIGASLVLLYTTTGGFRAVVWTDVLQAVLMIGAIVLLPVTLVINMGGLGVLWDRLHQLGDPTLTHPVGNASGPALLAFFGLWLGIPLGNPGQPHVLIRFMAIRDDYAVRRGAAIAMGWVFCLFSGAVVLGIVARAWYGELADPEKVLPTAALDFLPGALAGMAIAAVIAAVASTADSQLLICASAISHDLYVRLMNKTTSERQRVAIHRAIVLLVGLSATAIALTGSRTIFHFVLYAWAGLGSAFGPAIILKLLWWRTTAWGVLAGMVVGFAAAVVWIEVPMLKGIMYEMAPAFALGTLAVVAASLLSAPNGRGRPNFPRGR